MRKNNQEKEADKVLDRILNNSENELGKTYAKHLKQINAEIALMYSKAKGDPSLAEMSKYNNLENRRKAIADELTKMFSGVRSETLNMMESTYLESYFREAHNLEFQAQQKLGFGKINPKVVEEAINYPASGRPIRERFKTNRRRLLERLDEEITQGLVRGEGYRDVARRMRDRMDIDMNRALTTARTESGRIKSMAKNKAYEEAQNKGVEMTKFWDAELGPRTRDLHEEYDGMEADEEGLFELYSGEKVEGPLLSTEARETINCRCVTRSRVKGYEDNIRRARKSDGTYLTTAKNFDEWRNEKEINY